MLEWAMAHPWMTLLIVFMALLVIEGVVKNTCITINNGFRTKLALKDIEPKIEIVEEGDDDAGNSSDFISRDAALSALTLHECDSARAKMAIADIPAAKVRPVTPGMDLCRKMPLFAAGAGKPSGGDPISAPTAALI